MLNELVLHQGWETTVTASAFSQARQKLKHTAFIELNDDTVSTYYESSSSLKTYLGFRCLAVDGSWLVLPKTADIDAHFGSIQIKNQGLSDTYHSALCVCCYDVLNHLAVKSALVPGHSYEVDTSLGLLADFDAQDLLLYDRGYASYKLLASLVSRQINYVIRMPRCGFKLVRSMYAGEGAWRQVVRLAVPPHQKRMMAGLGLPETISVCFVRLVLPNGQFEVLATSLSDASLSEADFRVLYGKRWGVETFFGKLKGRLSLENFTGQTVESVYQDFWSTILISTIETVMTEDIDAAWQSSLSDRRYKKKVNKAVSFHAIKSLVFDLFYSHDPNVEQKLILLFQRNAVLERPKKVPPRKKLSPRRSLAFQKRLRKHSF